MSDDKRTQRIALFIDFENLVTNTGITAQSFDLKPTLDRLLENGKVIFRRAYCDWSRFREAKSHLHEHGVELVDVPPSTRSGKNGADMRLVIDALELCYAREHIDTYVIASGDSDFCPLAGKLRENDRYVIGVAVKRATSSMFVKACDEFIYLDTLRPARPPPQSRPRREDAPAKGHGSSSSSSAEVPALAREVVVNLLSRSSAPLNPSFLKEALVRKQPDFDERDFGFATFSKLLSALQKEGLCRLQQQGRQWYVLPAEGAAEGAAEAEASKDGGEEIIPDPED
ncbi:MAG: NYN domain-containing protein [Myxococcaceae bacterium]